MAFQQRSIFVQRFPMQEASCNNSGRPGGPLYARPCQTWVEAERRHENLLLEIRKVDYPAWTRRGS